jgi:hypothetical protein
MTKCVDGGGGGEFSNTDPFCITFSGLDSMAGYFIFICILCKEVPTYYVSLFLRKSTHNVCIAAMIEREFHV